MPHDCHTMEEVFDRHFDDVYGYVAYRLAPDREGARDVTQEVFLAAIKGWASYRGQGTLLAWLRGIARRKVADRLQLRYRDECQTDPATMSALAADSNEVPEPRAAVLADAMTMLPSDDVELLEEKYLEGLSVRQIGLAHGRTEKAVESALSRAREKLRQALDRLVARLGDDEHEHCRF